MTKSNKNSHNLREFFSTIYSVVIFLLIAISVIAILMFQNNKKLVQSNLTRYQSFSIANELRQSSDDLTRYSRTYIATGDSVWENKYWEVLDIRNGKKPRSDGRTIALQDSMRNLGFTDFEFKKLKESEQHSNELVTTEKIAFNAMKGLFADETGRFSIHRKPDTLFARTIMFNNKYHQDKSMIMNPIDDFIHMVEQRTQKQVKKYTVINNYLLGLLIGLILLVSIISIISYFLIKNKIITQLEILKTAKINLEESETRLKAIHDASFNGILLHDQGVLLDCNQTLSKINGYSIDELKGMNVLLLIAEESRKLVADNISIGYEKPYEAIALRKNGEKFPVHIQARGISYKGRQIRSVEVRDISEQKKAEKLLIDNEEKFRSIFENARDAIIFSVPNGDVTFVNPEAVKIFGYSNEEFIKIGRNGVVDINDERLPLALEERRKNKNFKGELNLIRKNGEVFPAIITSSIFNDSQGKEVVCSIILDITERKQEELKLKESETQLRELNATKDKLFSIIAHDLKSPFNSILGFSELLIENVKNYDIEESKKYSDFIYSAAENSLILLDNLLNWAKSQTGQIKLNLRKVDLLSFIQETIESSISIAKTKNISINLIKSDEITVYTDENMLKTILRNLISNAIKFTNTNGKINILAITHHKQVEITISDNGVGIDEDTIKKLFNISANITTKGTQNEKGSGLGLVLCKEFVEKLGGNIWVESEVNKGSDFKFKLPLDK